MPSLENWGGRLKIFYGQPTLPTHPHVYILMHLQTVYVIRMYAEPGKRRKNSSCCFAYFGHHLTYYNSVMMQLLPGIYGLRVTALAPSGQFGEKYVNVTVHDRPRDNTPPRPIISPSSNYTVSTRVIQCLSQVNSFCFSLWVHVYGYSGQSISCPAFSSQPMFDSWLTNCPMFCGQFNSLLDVDMLVQ